VQVLKVLKSSLLFIILERFSASSKGSLAFSAAKRL